MSDICPSPMKLISEVDDLSEKNSLDTSSTEIKANLGGVRKSNPNIIENLLESPIKKTTKKKSSILSMLEKNMTNKEDSLKFEL
jgi:predicted nucleotidyltransferase